MPNALDEAQLEVGQEIAGQVAPIQNLVDQYSSQSPLAVGQINQLFGAPKTGLTHQVKAVASDLKKNWGSLNAAQNQVFHAASAKLTQMRQQRAAEAQTLAQQLGAPVPISMFTDPVDAEISRSTSEFGGGILNAAGLASAGVQQAQAFSGQVFPMLQARQVQETKQFFREKIDAAKQQIAGIEGQRAGLVSARQRDLLVQDRQYQLQKLQADRDWYMSKQQLELRKQEIAQQAAKDPNDPKNIAKADYTMRQDNALKVLEVLMEPGSHDVKQLVGKDADGNPKYETVTVQGVPEDNPNRLIEKILASPGVNKTLKNKQFVTWLTHQIRTKGTSLGKTWGKEGWVYGQMPGSKDSIDSGARTLKQWQNLPLNSLQPIAQNLFGFKGNYPPDVVGEKARQQWLANWVWKQQEFALATSITTLN